MLENKNETQELEEQEVNTYVTCSTTIHQACLCDCIGCTPFLSYEQ